VFGRALKREPALINRTVLLAVALTGAGSVGAGILVAVWQPGAAVFGAAAGVLLLLFSFGRRLGSMSLISLALLLLGYAFFNRTFAHLGIAPVYVGEIALALSVLALMVTGRTFRLAVTEWLLLAFMLLGAARTVPYLAEDGIDAARDGALWGYGLFAFTVSSLLRFHHVKAVVSLYRKIAVAFLIWAPLVLVVRPFVEMYLPMLPGTDVDILNFKAGDAGVQLAGASAFTLVGLQAFPAFGEVLISVLWWAAFLVVSVNNRAGMLAASTSLVTTLLVRPSSRWITGMLVAILFGMVLATTNAVIDAGSRRNVSVSQLFDNATSIFTQTEGGLEGTKDFRLRWWTEIFDYTFGGEYFWTGKGFGVNLADDDGFQLSADHSLRAPHNTHMTILARMGVPGLLVWTLLQLTFGASLIRGIFRSRKAGETFWARITTWVLIYWLAMLVDTAFDPYLEGPQGAIWFWSLFGFGLAAIRLQTERANGTTVVHAPIALHEAAP
jgi:hypothetical protein